MPMSDEYKKILAENPDYRVFDGHLVDIMGTLLQNGKLNEPLYKSMQEASEKGENIFLYSSYFNPNDLARLGVDVEKFPILSKEDVFNYEEPACVVLGKIIDDKHPDDLNLNIILADKENGWVLPDKKEYSFSRKEKPEGLHNVDLCLKLKRQEAKRNTDPLKQKQAKLMMELKRVRKKLGVEPDKQQAAASNYNMLKKMVKKKAMVGRSF